MYVYSSKYNIDDSFRLLWFIVLIRAEDMHFSRDKSIYSIQTLKKTVETFGSKYAGFEVSFS